MLTGFTTDYTLALSEIILTVCMMVACDLVSKTEDLEMSV